jgi:type I restriction enzyme M protein
LISKVLSLHETQGGSKGRNQNAMRPEDVGAILTAYRSATQQDADDGVAVRLVPQGEIEANLFDLNIGRYVTAASAEVVDVATALTELRAAQAALKDAEERLDERLAEAGYG